MGTLGVLWGVGGVLLVLGYAVVHLSYTAVEAYSYEFQWYHWMFLAVATAFTIYAKAYRGFQRGLSPRIAARARTLSDNPTPLRVALAPFYCLGYFHIVRRSQISIITITVAMVTFVILVRLLGQPWRGIIDTGIAAGLAWGFVTILVYSVNHLRRFNVRMSPDRDGGR